MQVLRNTYRTRAGVIAVWGSNKEDLAGTSTVRDWVPMISYATYYMYTEGMMVAL